MNNEIIIYEIKDCIYTIRGKQVMLDSDLAKIYGVETKRLNEQVKRNIERFPEDFRFQLTQEELNIINLRSQNATSKEIHGGRRYLPYVFTEQGVSMLSAVLKSKTAVEISIKIMKAFVEMRRFISANAGIFQRIENIEQKQLESDKKFKKIFEAIDEHALKPQQGIFFDGQIFDAYVFVCDLIKSANKNIILIDNYIDETVLEILSKRKTKVSVDIYTPKLTKVLKQDLKKYNTQNNKVNIHTFTKAHDRFLILDNKTVYHFGASLKDLGKKWFAFSKMKLDAKDIIKKLGEKK